MKITDVSNDEEVVEDDDDVDIKDGMLAEARQERRSQM